MTDKCVKCGKIMKTLHDCKRSKDSEEFEKALKRIDKRDKKEVIKELKVALTACKNIYTKIIKDKKAEISQLKRGCDFCTTLMVNRNLCEENARLSGINEAHRSVIERLQDKNSSLIKQVAGERIIQQSCIKDLEKENERYVNDYHDSLDRIGELRTEIEALKKSVKHWRDQVIR